MEDVIIHLRRELLRLKLEKFIMLGLRMDCIPAIKGKVMIYGAGMLGKLLIRCFDEKPLAFIDAKVQGSNICGLSSYSIQEGVKRISKVNVTVIITPVWDYEKICNEILSDLPTANIISLEELVEKL